MTDASTLMSPALVALHHHDRADFALDYLQHMGLHAAPVLDDERRPLAVVSTADLAPAGGEVRVGSLARSPVISVAPTASLEEVAGVCADTGLHHVLVVDGGRAVGMISVIDVLRALLGRAVEHPPVVQVFRGVDCSGLDWRPEAWLTRAEVDRLPSAPGFVRVSAPSRGGPDRILRVARSHDVRGELASFLDAPPPLATWAAEGGPLRFSWAPARALAPTP